MSVISPTQFLEALRDHGVVVVEHDGWAGRTTAGGWDPNGVLHHHTAGSAKLLTDEATQAAMLRILVNGRAGLPGPLAHLAPAYQPWRKRAVVHTVGWGNVNHAGLGDSRVIAQIRADTYDGSLKGTREDADGNPALYGLEYMHPGDDTPWPDELIDVGARAAAAICQAHGWTAASNLEHWEFTDRKVDRSYSKGHPKRNVRADVAARFTTTQASPIPNVKELLSMELTDKITIPASYTSNTRGDGQDEVITVETLLRRLHDWTFRAAFQSSALTNGITAGQVADEIAKRLAA